MQPNLFPPSESDKLRELLADNGFMHEFEVIAEAVSRGFQAKGSLEEVYTQAITFLHEVIENEQNTRSNNEAIR